MATAMNPKTVVENTLVPHTAFWGGKARIEQCYENAGSSPEPICLAVIGESRTGKSRLLEEASRPWKTMRTKEGLYVPTISIKTPARPTVKGVVTRLLEELGDPQWDKGTETVKTMRLEKLIERVGTKVLFMDEFQHFHDRNLNKVSQEVADWLKSLVDETKICLVVVGLPNCQAVIDQSEQLSGRFLHPIKLPRFDWADEKSREEFAGILGAFFESISFFLKYRIWPELTWLLGSTVHPGALLDMLQRYCGKRYGMLVAKIGTKFRWKR